MGFPRQEYWSDLTFPSPVDHILWELSTITQPSWVAQHGMAHSFIELDKAVVHVISLIEVKWSEVKSLSHVQLFATLWIVAYQAPPSMGISMQEYWSGLPFPSPGDLPNPGIKPGSPALEADILTSEPPGKPSVWLVFCNCSFHPVCPLMDEDNGIMEAPWWGRLTVRGTGSCSDVGKAMLTKSSIQISVAGQDCVPSRFETNLCWR